MATVTSLFLADSGPTAPNDINLTLRDAQERVLAPEFLNPRVATAAIAVELVVYGFLLVIILMVFLGRVERPGDLDRGNDRLFQDTGCLKFAFGVFRQSLLIG